MLEAARDIIGTFSFCTVSIIDMDGPLELQPSTAKTFSWLISFLTARTASVSSLLLSRIINSSRWPLIPPAALTLSASICSVFFSGTPSDEEEPLTSITAPIL
ncbi:MAG: hypothetical protein BWY65_02273 [Firmicutes bacterium ADurb.Bin373]|nr:MAG: hypothetical protein BWY65_02273 [Firmicutes bacterium ADurb.Bin373]